MPKWHHSDVISIFRHFFAFFWRILLFVSKFQLIWSIFTKIDFWRQLTSFWRFFGQNNVIMTSHEKKKSIFFGWISVLQLFGKFQPHGTIFYGNWGGVVFDPPPSPGLNRGIKYPGLNRVNTATSAENLLSRQKFKISGPWRQPSRLLEVSGRPSQLLEVSRRPSRGCSKCPDGHRGCPKCCRPGGHRAATNKIKINKPPGVLFEAYF